jgi:hypothetical protein
MCIDVEATVAMKVVEVSPSSRKRLSSEFGMGAFDPTTW